MEELIKKQKQLIAELRRAIELDDDLLKGYRTIVEVQENSLERCRSMINDLKKLTAE